MSIILGGIQARRRALLSTGGGSIPESSLFFNRAAYLISPPISEADMVSTTPVTKTIVATTKNKYATSARATTSQDSSITRHILSIGPTSMTELNFEAHNWWFLANTTEEQINSVTLSVEAALVDLTTGLRARFKFGGNNEGTVPITAGSAFLVSDTLSPAAFGLTLFPAHSRWLLVVRRTAAGAATLGLPWHSTNQSLTRELEFEYQYSSATTGAAAIAAAYLDAAPALSQFAKDGSNNILGVVTGPSRPNSGASGLSCAGGYVITGRANAKTRAVIFVADSKGDGTADTQTPQPTDEGNGWIGRCLRDPTTGLVIASSHKATMSGDRSQYRAAVDALSGRCYGQANIGFIAIATNGIKGGRTALQEATDHRTIAQRMKAQGVRKVIVASCDPQTASSDGWLTPANQNFTGFAMFDPAGTHIRQDFNAMMAADAAAGINNIDVFCDFTTVTDDGSTGKWASAGGTQAMTADGIHELPAMAALKATVARAAILGIAPDFA